MCCVYSLIGERQHAFWFVTTCFDQTNVALAKATCLDSQFKVVFIKLSITFELSNRFEWNLKQNKAILLRNFLFEHIYLIKGHTILYDISYHRTLN